MSTNTLKIEDTVDPDVVNGRSGGSPTLIRPKAERTRIKVGGICVTSDKASAAELKRAVAKSADMLERLGHKIVKPGVKLKAVRNVPLYSVDPKHPGRFLRKLNGKTDRGVLENGVFKVVD